MGKWKHRLSDIDVEARAALCSECGPVKIKQKGDGYWRCKVRARQWTGSVGHRRRGRRGKHVQFKKSQCELCQFVPEDPCQLDVHHLDENHRNNDPLNLQTLCANCHRLVTKKDRDKKKTAETR